MSKKIFAFIFILIILCGAIAIRAAADTYTNYVVVIDEFGKTHIIYPDTTSLITHPVAIYQNYNEDTIVVYPTNPPVTIATEETANIQTENNSQEEKTKNQEISNDLAKELFELTNKERVAAGLTELTYNFDLQDPADLRAAESSIKFDHTRPNGDICYSVFNVDYTVAGENLIQADKPIANAENLMKTWMESEGHRANILLPEFTSVAIGIYTKDDVIYASQLFVG